VRPQLNALIESHVPRRLFCTVSWVFFYFIASYCSLAYVVSLFNFKPYRNFFSFSNFLLI